MSARGSSETDTEMLQVSVAGGNGVVEEYFNHLCSECGRVGVSACCTPLILCVCVFLGVCGPHEHFRTIFLLDKGGETSSVALLLYYTICTQY